MPVAEQLNLNLIRAAGADAPAGKTVPAILSACGDQLYGALLRLPADATPLDCAELVGTMTNFGLPRHVPGITPRPESADPPSIVAAGAYATIGDRQEHPATDPEPVEVQEASPGGPDAVIKEDETLGRQAAASVDAVVGGSTCRTCGGTGGHHNPSVLDINGTGHPDHRMDNVRETAAKALARWEELKAAGKVDKDSKLPRADDSYGARQGTDCAVWLNADTVCARPPGHLAAGLPHRGYDPGGTGRWMDFDDYGNEIGRSPGAW